MVSIGRYVGDVGGEYWTVVDDVGGDYRTVVGYVDE